jgi:two-component system, LytTR family, sensor kinase
MKLASDNSISMWIKYKTIIIHFLAWSFSYALLFAGRLSNEPVLTLKMTIIFFIFLILFYFNLNVLVPMYLNARKFLHYFTFIILAITGIVILNYVIDEVLKIPQVLSTIKSRNGGGPPASSALSYSLQMIFPGIFILAISSAIRSVQEALKLEKHKREIENQNLSSELTFLRQQVSPHFLFNTLNNIYALSTFNQKATSDAILKLSEILRYMLYDVSADKISLKKEIIYLHHYIELQKLRLKEDVVIQFNIVENLPDVLIHPMLFIPFIENSFKHGISYMDNCYIHIKMEAQDHQLIFEVENKNNWRLSDHQVDSGIGLENVKKRLNLLYPGKHRLTINDGDENFKIVLILEIL